MGILIAALFFASNWAQGTPVRVGSKYFVEGQLLGELAAQTLEVKGFPVERRLGLGGTGILFAALQKGEIDVYPEYSGTISEAILKQHDLHDLAAIRRALIAKGLTISDSLGFSDSYGLAMTDQAAKQKGVQRI